jgi:hypothetical protein
MSLVVTEAILSAKISAVINPNIYSCSFNFKLKDFNEQFALICMYNKEKNMENWKPNSFHVWNDEKGFERIDLLHPLWGEAASIFEQIQSFVRNELFLHELKHGIVRKYH